MRTLLTLLLFFGIITNSYAGAINVDQFVTADDVTIAHLEQMRATFQTAINAKDGSLLQAQTISTAALDANANPENRWNEGFNDFIFTGLLPPTSSDLTSVTTSGTVYMNGVRVVKDATSKTYTASKQTFVDISSTGTFTYSEVTIGASEPSVAANSIRLARVSTDGTTVAAVRDDRVTTITLAAGSTGSIADTDGDTQIQTEESDDEDKLRFDTEGVERMVLDDTGLIFEGATADNFETLLAFSDVTADQTITMPDNTGTVLTTGSNLSSFYNIGTFNRDNDAATGLVAYGGVGFTPSYIMFFAVDHSFAGRMSLGFDDNSTQISISDSSGVTADEWDFQSSDSLYFIESSGKAQGGELNSFFSDGFRIDWTRTGVTAAGTQTIMYWAFR